MSSWVATIAAALAVLAAGGCAAEVEVEVDGVAIIDPRARGGPPYACDLTDWGVAATRCADVALDFTIENRGAAPLPAFTASLQLPNGWSTFMACTEPLAPGDHVDASLTYAFERNPTLRWSCGGPPGEAFVRVAVTPVVVDSAAALYFDLVRPGDAHTTFHVDLAFDVAD